MCRFYIGNIMINSVKPITEYVQMCRSSGGNFLKPNPKLPALDFDRVTFTKVAQSFDDIFESKTLRRLFTDKFKPTRQVDEFGNRVTTVIDRKTGKPVEVVIKDKYDKYEFMANLPNGQEDYLGYIEMHLYDGVYIEEMNTERGNLKYAGIGTRMHQFAIEMSMKYREKGRVFFESSPDAAVFHYKNGFRPLQIFQPLTQDEIDYRTYQSGFHRVKLKLSDITTITNGKPHIDTNALCYEPKIRLDILNGKRIHVMNTISMELRGEQLEKWKARIATQPILLD